MIPDNFVVPGARHGQRALWSRAKMRARLTLVLLVVPIVLWVLFAAFGARAAARVSSRFGSRILAGADGKFTDVPRFVEGRLSDAVVLGTAGCLLILAQLWAASASRRLRAPARWMVEGWSAFLCLNVFAAVAAHTVLFWCLVYTGKEHINNYTQWRIKQGLMRENKATAQAVLLGASQTRTQIDTKVVNERLAPAIWTTELHFPGSCPYDMVLCLERLPDVHLDYVITYVSEPSFYGQGSSERLMYFFGFRNLDSYWRLGPGRPDFDRFAVSGLLGDVFPLYRIWEPLADRLRGAKNEGQERYDLSIESDLAQRAQRVAKEMCPRPQTAFQKAAFALLARCCRERHCRLVVCCGQLNPILEQAMDPALRADMTAFLRELAAKDPNIVLLEESQMPRQSAEDYEDLTHVNAATRAQFSHYIAGVLQQLARAKAP